jgi:PAS domain S-box-containing protein
LSAASDPKEVATAVLTATDELFGWDACAVDIFSEIEDEVLTIAAFDTVDGKRIEFPSGMGENIITPIFKKTIQEGPQLVLRNIDKTNQDRELIPFGNKIQKSASLMFVPIKKNNQNIGILTIQSYLYQAYNTQDLELLQTVADYGGGALERTIARIKLQESEERYRQLIDYSPYPTAVIRDQRVVLVNKKGMEIFGASNPEQLIGKPIFDLITSEYHDLVRERARFILEEGKSMPLAEMKLKRLDGTIFDAELASLGIRQQNKSDILVVGRDITDRKLAEAKIRQYQEELRKLSTELSLAEERERRRIAQSLHDNIGQILALGKIKFGELTADTKSPQLADEIRALMDQAIQYTRSLTLELSPPILYEVGFEPAIEWLAEQIQTQYNLPIQIKDDFQPKPLDSELRVLLYQVVRELLINVGKHSQARQAVVSLERDNDNIRIIVADDGLGFEIAELESRFMKTGHYGLFSIQERLFSIGGKITIDSGQNKGTRITIVVSLKAKK